MIFLTSAPALAFTEQWALISSQFHWLRPWWLLALVPALLLTLALWQQKRGARQWHQLIAADLLPFLVDGKTTRAKRGSLLVLLAAWIIASLALAGPSWEKLPVPVQKNQNALVILLDLSPSMLSEDIKPSRLVRARLKITDILRARRDGLTAFVVYAGEAHVVTPLTDDTVTIQNLVNSVHPEIMPLKGSNIEDAVARSVQLLRDAGINQGDLLLLTDGVVSDAHPAIKKLLTDTQFRLSIIGVGSNMPVPIPSDKGNFVRDQFNNIVTTQLDEGELRSLAQQNAGRYSRLSSDSRDIDWLLSQSVLEDNNYENIEREFDSWIDRGHWLLLLLLPIVLYCFRRGVIVVILLVPTSLLFSNQSHALSWNDLWLTKDQQAQRALQAGDAKQAAEIFENPDWKGSAQYRANDFEAAAKHFAQSDTAQAHYNRGNALSKAGKLEDGIKAYDEALKRQPDFPEAKANRELVKKLLEQQQQDQSQDGEQQDQENDEQQEQNEQNQDQNQEGESDNEQQDSEQQNSEQDSNEQDSQQQDSSEQSDTEESQNDQSSSEQNEQEQQDQEQQNQQADAEENEQEKPDAEQQAAQQKNEEQQSEEDNPEAQAAQAMAGEGELNDEEQQAMEQWLRRVPDDPSGLLRNKFRYQYQQQQRERNMGEWQSPDNSADQRW